MGKPYVVDIDHPPIGPPNREFRKSFSGKIAESIGIEIGSFVETKESKRRTQEYKEYLKLYQQAVSYAEDSEDEERNIIFNEALRKEDKGIARELSRAYRDGFQDGVLFGKGEINQPDNEAKMSRQRYRGSIVIRKLSDKTGLQDCRQDLWEWLGMSRKDVKGQSGSWNRCPLVGDLTHDIWQCAIQGHYYYGKTLVEVAAQAGIEV